MPYITFSKSYSSSDDGSKLTGADLGQLETDIAQVLNGGITNVNISGTAAIGEAKIAFDSVAGHTHNGTDSANVAGGNVLRSDITGCGLQYVSVNTVNADSGAVELNNIVYTRNAISSTINLSTDAHWVGGTNHRATNSTFYVYAYNDSGTTWDIKFWDSAPQFANCGTDTEGTLVFRESAGVWYRCIGTAVTNATGSGELTANTVSSGYRDPDINGLGEKTTLADNDIVIIEDSAASYVKKKVKKSNLITLGAQEYTTSSGNWTCPAGVTRIWVTMCGGGAGGACSNSGGTPGAGGGSGNFYVKVPMTVTPSTAYAYVVGSGGAGGASGGANLGSPGVNTTFSTLTAQGGLAKTFADFTNTTPVGAGDEGKPGSPQGTGVGGSSLGPGGEAYSAAPANSGGGGGGSNTTGGAGGSGYILIEW